MTSGIPATHRRVLITGGSRGIGAAIAQRFAAAGDRVAIHYSTGADAAAEVLAALPGDGHTMVQADLRDPNAVKSMVDSAAAHLGGIDVLVNNAGVFFSHRIDDVSYEEWQQAWSDTLGVNLIGAANVTWCALHHMPRGGSSRIVNVGSRGAFRGEPDSPAYGESNGRQFAITEGNPMCSDIGVGQTVLTTNIGDAKAVVQAYCDPASKKKCTKADVVRFGGHLEVILPAAPGLRTTRIWIETFGTKNLSAQQLVQIAKGLEPVSG